MKSLPTTNVLHNYRSECRYFSRPAECSLSQLFVDEGSCQNRQDDGELVTKNITIKTDNVSNWESSAVSHTVTFSDSRVHDDVEKTLISAASVDVFLLFTKCPQSRV